MKRSAIGDSTHIQETYVKNIIDLLTKAYPRAKIALTYHNSWELLVSVILSAQCTDIMVNKVTEHLFKKYRSLNDYIQAPQNDFEQDIKSTGFFRNKARNIINTARLIKEQYNGQVPKTMEELLKLPGVARKTANVILGNAYGIVEGIAVDTHVHRISQRLRIVNLDLIGGKNSIYFQRKNTSVVDYKKDADPNKIEQELMKIIPKEYWFRVTYLIIDHGRAICKSQNPQCADCVLRFLCPVSRV